MSFCQQTIDERFAKVAQHAQHNDDLRVPQFAVHAQFGAGSLTFSKHWADDEKVGPRCGEPIWRWFSNSKVVTSAAALILHERGLLRLDQPVEEFIPSFKREWAVVRALADGEAPRAGDGEGAAEEVTIVLPLRGVERPQRFTRRPARHTMLVSHLMGEASGVGYDMWQDMMGDPPDGRHAQYPVCHALRVARNAAYPDSTRIVGGGLTLAEFCDTVAAAGVLVSEPGEYSYGHGATVLGRVIEVAYNRNRAHSRNGGDGRACRPKPLSEILAELLLRPLGMECADAPFFLKDGDPRAARVVPMFAGRMQAGGADASRGAEIVPVHDTLDDCGRRVYRGTADENSTAHTRGPRLLESGDTGLLMTLGDMARFYRMLCGGGVGPTGACILSAQSVDTLCRRVPPGLGRATGNALAREMGVAGGEGGAPPAVMTFGWATTHPFTFAGAAAGPRANYWSGYCNTQAVLNVDEGAFLLIATQVQGYSQGGRHFMPRVLVEPAKRAYYACLADRARPRPQLQPRVLLVVAALLVALLARRAKRN
eukprot:g6314.t1